MPALPFPKYNITNLYLFPTYATRDDYKKATGQEPPPWNQYRQPKRWFDPKAKTSPSRKVVYDHALALDPDTGAILHNVQGLPYLDALVLDREEAATVNIPPTEPNVPGADVSEVPAPMRALEPNEELCFGFGGVPMVKNKDLYAQLEEVGYTQRDRDLLEAIAAKLGVA